MHNRDKAVTFANDSLFLNSIAELGEQIGSKIASRFSDKMSELANNIDRLSVRVEDYKKNQENLEGITQKKEIDIGEDPILEIDPILEEGMMKTDTEGDFKIDMICLIQEKGLIDIKQNTDQTLETDIEGMTDIEMMTDTEEMKGIEMMMDTEEIINLTKRARFGVTSVNLWVIIH